MRILYLTHTCPYPPNRGDRIRCYHILTHLSQAHTVTLAYPIFDDEHQLCQKHLKAYCESIIPVQFNRYSSYIACLMALGTSRPLSIAFFYSRQLKKQLKQVDIDLVIADCSTMAQYVLNMSSPKILDFVDVDSQKWSHYASMSRFPASLLYRLEARRLAHYERLLTQRFDRCLVTSSHERALLSPASNVDVLANGVDQQYFSPSNVPTDGSIIFTGVMNYFPNSDAVLHFHRQVFPLIRQALPATRFIIAGMHPTAQIQSLADEHTVVTGFVSDIREYLAKAAVCVVPLRIAMGVQNKIIEAMAMGVPVVATSQANRGIQATHGREILVADDPKDFAAATIALLNDPKRRATIAHNARTFIEQHYRWDKNLQKLDEVISEVGRSSSRP